MSNQVYSNVRLPGCAGLKEVVVSQGTIAAIHPQPNAAAPDSIDFAGDWLSLGGIDLQINGALGLAFPDLNPANADKLNTINDFLWQQGVDAYLPTLVTTSVENIQRSLAVIAAWQKVEKGGGRERQSKEEARSQESGDRSASIIGVHLEGPFLNPEKRGAHPKEYLQPLTIANVQRVLGDHADVVKVMTLAPELDETGKVIPYLRSLGITVSLGHSLATAEQAQHAFEQGATMVTHAFNAMPPLHHRQPGLLGAAIANPRVQCGLIADGQHVSRLMMDILLKASSYEQGIFLVSDALSPLGLPDGIYPWDTRQIEVTQGTARLPDGTLSGTTLGLLVGAENLVKWGICNVEQAIALATLAPRHAIGLSTNYIGQPAHLLRWHPTETGDLSWKRIEVKVGGAVSR